MADLVTFGETMLRLSPPDDVPIELAESFDVHAGGAESNVAVAAQRLGLETVWLSKLPETPPGRRAVADLRRHGVTPAVVWSDSGRQGLYYLETGDTPRETSVVYDREHAAVCSATPAELPTDHVEDARVFLTTGITPALSERLAETTKRLLALASDAGTTTWFDLNYRSQLWSPAEARETVTDLTGHVDGLVVAKRDVETVFERTGPVEEVATALAGEHEFETVVVTRSAEGALAVHDGEVFEQSAYPAGDSHPVGSGDAFVGGLLARRLQGGSVSAALAYGAATAALKRAIPGDVAAVTPADVERVLEGPESGISR
jgi:2-dehydro-3-deoxygluconokinase